MANDGTDDKKGTEGTQEEHTRSIAVKLYQGMPQVEISEEGLPHIEMSEEERLSVRLDFSDTLKAKLLEIAARGPIKISLESLNIDLLSNQSFGMVDASTGCISSPGGPSC